jgi:hypothetical protein
MSAPVSCCEYNCIKQRRQMDRKNAQLCNEVQLFYDIPDKGWNIQDYFYVPLPYILHLTDSCPFSKEP